MFQFTAQTVGPQAAELAASPGIFDCGPLVAFLVILAAGFALILWALSAPSHR